MSTVNDPLSSEVNRVFQWNEKRVDVIFDCLQTHVCHGMEFPDEMTRELFDKINTNMIWVYDSLFQSEYNNYTYAQISIASFMAELRQILDSAHTYTSSVKASFFAGHDTTLIPMLTSFGVWNKQWPPYASLLQIELLTSTQNGEDFVRLIYNNQELLLPGCGFVSPCPYEVFWQLTQNVIDASLVCDNV
eukprot:TRINITY_DN11930_c0_g1_i1.p1 TRINITY_DN11930_c0_g1~~TRINITY_DN11930_c0_g1_i1.p1  ORF type:complete len:215 (-),score=55.29 TRINITY_DN11930_c0_g1_i1:27-596(-)